MIWWFFAHFFLSSIFFFFGEACLQLQLDALSSHIDSGSHHNLSYWCIFCLLQFWLYFLLLPHLVEKSINLFYLASNFYL